MAVAFEKRASQGFMRALWRNRMMVGSENFARSCELADFANSSFRLRKGAGKVTKVNCPVLLLVVVVVLVVLALGWCLAAESFM